MATQDPADDTAAQPAADRTLVVVHAFGDYRRGDSITDPREVAAVLASENANHCRKVIPQ
ncbi:hypothetical protein [Burkholderia gladioli]|uniref:hypothetical protein n=1 Tax=Burkholderia gladioli TaxID=28095 RepID=UPI00163E3280|nr:hypothetical protein [Burkholderia gladioli]